MTLPPTVPRRPRVLHFVTHLALGGAERVVLDLARGLHGEFESAVFAVHGVAHDAVGQSMQAELAELGIPLHTGTCVPMKAGGMFFAGIAAAKAVGTFRPDLIHLHTEIPEAAYAAMVTMHRDFAAIPLARTIHNAVYWHHWPRLGRWCERRMSRPWIAAVSHDALRAFERHRAASGCGENPLASTVIYNGVSDHVPRRKETQPTTPVVRVLFAGRLEESKGADLLPRILSAVELPTGVRAELSIIGRGKFESLLRKFARLPPPGWTVRVQAPIANLATQIHEYDLLLVPSRYEGLGLVAIEAALACVPVVATDAPGLRETIPPAHPWVAKAGDAASFAKLVQGAIAERNTWPEIISRAQGFARQRFAPAAMNAAYAQLYTQTLARA